jgi:hypothetical protein
MPHETGGRSFDELARELAAGTVSRRKALRLMGAALVGGALASFPGAVWAARGGNSACVRTCKAQETPGKGRGQRISAAAKGEGCAPGSSCEDVPFDFECPENSKGVQICLDVEGEAVVEGVCCPHETSSGATCVANICTGTIDCVCCPLGAPCPCLQFDLTDPCISPALGCQ